MTFEQRSLRNGPSGLGYAVDRGGGLYAAGREIALLRALRFLLIVALVCALLGGIANAYRIGVEDVELQRCEERAP